jgi:hypothetical protein
VLRKKAGVVSSAFRGAGTDLPQRFYMTDVAFPQTFKFKGLRTTLAFLALFDAICIALAFLTLTSEGGGVGGMFFCLGCALFVSMLGWIYVLGSSDILLGVDGVSRVFLGRRMRFIAWRDVGKVTVFPVRSAGASRVATGYNLIPAGPDGGLEWRRKIYFSSRSTDLADLLKSMNIFIKKYEIKVERESDGRVVVSSSL